MWQRYADLNLLLDVDRLDGFLPLSVRNGLQLLRLLQDLFRDLLLLGHQLFRPLNLYLVCLKQVLFPLEVIRSCSLTSLLI